MRIAVVTTSLTLSVVGLSVAADSDAAIRRHTDIPAQELGSALRGLAKERNFQIVYATQDVAERQTMGAVGELTAAEALQQLLEDTGLTFRPLDENTITILSRDDGASTSVSPQQGSKPERIGEGTQSSISIGADAPSSGDEKEAPKSFWQRIRLAQAEARDTTRTSEAGSAADAPGPEKVMLEEIIVTAQKRTERLQDIPLSIAALTADDISRRGLVSQEDYLRGMPGVNQAQGPFGGAIIIRGIETAPGGGGTGTVATYFDEAPTTNAVALAGVDIKLVDIERVEVLRGPQGTAFGSASMGGAVRTIPMAPKLNRFEGKVAANYSVTSGNGSGNHMIQAVGNLPLIDEKLAIRATAYRFEDSGYYRNVAGSSPDFQTYSALFGAQAFATDDDEVGATRFTGGRLSTLFQASDDLKFTLSYMTQKTELDGWAHAGTDALATANLATLGTYQQALWQVAPQHVMRGEKSGVKDNELDIANATVEYDLGWGSLLGTFSHIENEAAVAFPFPFSVPFSQRGLNSHRENSGEVRLTTQLAGAWNFLGGVYAEEVKDQGFFDYYWFGSPGTNVFGSPTSFLGSVNARSELKQKAVFAEASWRFLPALTLTGGVRAYDYENTSLSVNSGALFPDPDVPLQGDASGTNFRGNLSYKPGENTLVYASWSQGFRLGRPQAELPRVTCDVNNDGILDGTTNVTIASTGFIDSDTVDSFEVGTKLTMLERRLTIAGAVYRIEWDGLPFPTRAPAPENGGCGRTYQTNAGSALSEGIELETNFQVTDAFRIDLGASRIRAVLTEDVPNLPVPAFDGDRLPGSPKFTANLGLQYSFDISNYEAYIRTDSIYVGNFFSGIDQIPQSEAGDYVKLDVSAQVAIGNIGVNVFVRNLTNADDFTLRDDGGKPSGDLYGYRLRPRTIGVQLDYNF